MWIKRNRKYIISVFILLSLGALASLPYLKFSFDFERFFPDNDPDLEFYQEFIKEFESDDNYLLIAIKDSKTVVSSAFLKRVARFTEDVAQLDLVVSSVSLPTIQKPSFGPMGFSFSRLLSIENDLDLKSSFAETVDKNSLLKNLVAEDRKSTVVALKVKERIQIDESQKLLTEIDQLITTYSFSEHHYLGRAYFQHELSRLQVTEVLYSSIFSFLVVSLILFLLYRNKYLIFITLGSITMGLILFLGLLSVMGREFDAMSALYPVLMLIVGSSDVIHILSKYLDELRSGNAIGAALDTTIRQIGLATLFTSATTAIGFISLITSRIGPVRNFGVNAGIGVLVAYITIILFTTALLTYFSPEKLKTHKKTFILWDKIALWFYNISKRHLAIYSFSFVLLLVCGYGLTQISTDYKLENSLPRGKKITEDFRFFEENYSGFRPVEYVLFRKDGNDLLNANSIETLQKIETKLLESPYVESATSIATLFKMITDNIPIKVSDKTQQYESIKPLLDAAIKASPTVLINSERTKARLSAQIKDVGADEIKKFHANVDEWFNGSVDTAQYSLKYTGTGQVIDKNAIYVRESLIQGLLFALLVIGILMGLLFRSIKMVFLSFIPNAIPLVIAGAILGYSGIPLEPLTSITFVVIFGIAVDDTIHFLSKYRLALHSGLSIEESIKISFMESGKAILFTTVVLFFGFMVMLFSYNPASVVVGGLISITLFTAVFADLILLPVLLRVFKVS